MAKTFEVRIRGDPSDNLKRVMAVARRNDVVFHGDTKRGTFRKEVNIPLLGRTTLLDGKYESDGASVRVTLHKIPPGYSQDRVEAMVREFFEGA